MRRKRRASISVLEDKEPDAQKIICCPVGDHDLYVLPAVPSGCEQQQVAPVTFCSVDPLPVEAHGRYLSNYFAYGREGVIGSVIMFLLVSAMSHWKVDICYASNQSMDAASRCVASS